MIAGRHKCRQLQEKHKKFHQKYFI